MKRPNQWCIRYMEKDRRRIFTRRVFKCRTRDIARSAAILLKLSDCRNVSGPIRLVAGKE